MRVQIPTMSKAEPNTSTLETEAFLFSFQSLSYSKCPTITILPTSLTLIPVSELSLGDGKYD